MAEIKELSDLLRQKREESTQEVLEPKTMAELKNVLMQEGARVRAELKEKNKVPARAVADIVLKYCHVILIDEDNPELSPLAVYDLDEGIYRKGDRFISRLAMKVERTLTERDCNHVKHYLSMDAKERERTYNSNLIVVNNGVFNRETKQLEPFTPEYIFLNKVATNYNADATEPQFDGWTLTNWIKELSDGDKDKEELFWQIFTASINSNYISETAVFFLSESGRTGKGTFQQLLINLVGRKNFASLKLKEFEKPFTFASAYGKSLIIGDDNNPKDFNETSENFKSVVTGDPIVINAKHEKPFTTRLTPFVVQSMNGLPRFKDSTDGLLRRIRIVKFNHAYKGEDNNRQIKDSYIYDNRLLEYVLARALHNDFIEMIEPQESKNAVHDLEVENNMILEFYESIFQELRSNRLPMSFLFELYVAWCSTQNNPTKVKQRTFTKEFRQIAEGRNEWTYYRKNHASLEAFKQEDWKKLKQIKPFNMDIHEVDPIKRCPLIERVEN
ncbi:DNA primase family protein [Holzapfeliella sp. JNUCC 72]